MLSPGTREHLLPAAERNPQIARWEARIARCTLMVKVKWDRKDRNGGNGVTKRHALPGWLKLNPAWPGFHGCTAICRKKLKVQT